MNKKIDTLIGIILSKYLKHIRTFCANKKYQKALRMDAFLTASETDGFWVLWNSLGYPHFMRITNVQTVLALFQKPLTPAA